MMKNTILKSFRVKNFKQFKELFLDFSKMLEIIRIAKIVYLKIVNSKSLF